MFEAQPPIGPRLRLHHGPTADYLWWLGSYEQPVTEVFSRLAARASLVLDIGARDGLYTLFAAAANPAARILAFEPEPQGAALLRANVDANAALTRGRVLVVETALGAYDGSGWLFVAGGNTSLNPDFRRGSPAVPVAVRQGDTVLAEIAPGQRVGLMKIDTESTEPEVLDGLRVTVARDRPVIVCEVLVGRTECALSAFVEANHYTIWRADEKRLKRLPYVVGDPTYRRPNLLLAPSELDLPDLVGEGT